MALASSGTMGRLLATKGAVAHGAGAAGTTEARGLTGAESGLGGDRRPALDAFGLDIFDGLRGWSEAS